MASTDNQAPWGYLLRLPVGSGAIALLHKAQVVSHNGKNYFSVKRCMFGDPEIRDMCGVCSINDKPINKVSHIEHGGKISLIGKEFIFVDCDKSDKILRLLSINKTHALGQILGKGGFGEVHLCFNKKTTSGFALKITASGNDREKKILVALKHPHVISTKFIETVGRVTFIGMEYMMGGDLSSYIQPGRVHLTEGQIKLVFYQVVNAICYLHKEGICHRDLKPHNILLARPCPRTLVKVTDLGLAKSELLHSPMDSLVGTYRFMAPEIIMQSYTNKVDVWSLGVILHLSLTGSFHKIIDKEVYLSSFPSNKTLRKLLQSMLKVSSKERISIMEVAKNQWLQDDVVKIEVAILKREHAIPPTVEVNVNSIKMDPLEQEYLNAFQKTAIGAVVLGALAFIGWVLLKLF